MVNPSTLLAKRLAGLTEEQRKKLNLNNLRKGVAPRDRSKAVPLSEGQKRIWTLEEITPGTATYNMPVGYRLEGPLHITALKAAFEELSKRHEALRTTFKAVNEGDEPQQIVHDSPLFDFKLVDMTRAPRETVEADLARLGAEEVKQPFDLANGPLLRVTVFQLAPTTNVLVINVHHIISDGWSHGIMIRELSSLYRSALAGTPSDLPPQSIHYPDYTIWKDASSRELVKKQLAFWKEQLKGGLTLLELPADRPRPAVQTQNGGAHHFRFSPEIAAGMKQIAAASKASLYMTLLSAFDVLVHRFSGQTDLLVGTPVAGRTESDVENMIGYFANTIVMRTNLEGDPTFRELVAKNRDIALAAFSHQDLSFERLVEELQPERAMSYNPIFQVMFTFQNQPLSMPDFPAVAASWNQFHTATCKFDLWLGMEEQDGGLMGHFEYNTDIFDRTTIERLHQSFEVLMKSLIESPDSAISTLPILTDEARRGIMDGFNDTEKDYGGFSTLQAAFEAQVARTPDAVALRFEGQSMTYAELNEKANQLAHYLVGKGVKANDLVCIAIERSFEMFVGIYATIKAGGAYVPLDPAFPKNRLAFMMGDTKASILLTQSKHKENLPSFEGSLIAVDGDWETISKESKENLGARSGLQDLAYMIFTSGSTGNPKGAMVHHEAISNRLLWMQEYFQLDASDVILQKTPTSFDVSVWELFWALQIGAKIAIAKPEGHKDPAYLVETIQKEGVTTIHFVPTMLRLLLEEGAQEATNLKRVICSGEELPVRTVEIIHEQLPNAEITNLYGPTECAVDVSVYTARPGQFPKTSIPIGISIANTQLYVLDKRFNPTPIGVSGELFIGGIQVGRGYRNRPELTAEKFIDDPFSKRPGAKLYRTGDRARFLPDGNIEFLGRLDHQVKVNGLRIETGEIENVLREHQDVSQALVVVAGEESKRLVAYVVPKMSTFTEMATDSEKALSGEQVTQWQDVFDQNYAGHVPDTDEFNIVGWNSSYDSQPMPAEDMKQWVDYTVERILSYQPKAIFEIGCGTGLLLYKLAPHCERFLGTDLSPVAIQGLRANLSKPQYAGKNIDVQNRTAENFEGIEPASFDVIVVNSVVQYFPTIDYLEKVIRNAVKVLKPGGKIFLGDIRNYGLIEAFNAGVAVAQADDTQMMAQLSKVIQRRISEENELTLDPSFFASLPSRVPEIGRVEIKLKKGTYLNELSKFRYDVTLHAGPTTSVEPVSIGWSGAEAIRKHIHEKAPQALVVRNVPNGRLDEEKVLLEALESISSSSSVGDLKARLIRASDNAGVNPNLWIEMGQELGYLVDISWSTDGKTAYDVLFEKSTDGQRRSVMPSEAMPDNAPAWHEMANNPLLNTLKAELIPALKTHLKAKLPEYMVPSSYCLLNAFPLSPSGKISRSELPEPFDNVVKMGEIIPATTPTECLLANIWCEVLNVPAVGVNSNFFELGGDSIKTIQVVWRAKKQGVLLTAKQMFLHQTLGELAAAVGTPGEIVEEGPAPEVVLEDYTKKFPSWKALQESDANIEAVYPMAPMSEFQLHYLQSNPHDGLSVVWLVMPFEAALNEDVYKETWRRIVERHPILRSSFHFEGLEQPAQVIYKKATIPYYRVDIKNVPAEEQNKIIYEHIDRLWKEGYKVENPPQNRVIMFETGEKTCKQIYSWNYMVHDGWSLSFIVRDFVLTYEALVRGREPKLDPVPDYKPYLQWLAKQDLGKAEKFWREKLKGFKTPTPLAERIPGNQMVATDKYSKQFLPFGAEKTAEIYAFNRNYRVTLSTLFHSAWALLVSRYTQEADIAFGTMVSGRGEGVEGIEKLIGQCCNVLPFRIGVPREKTALDFFKDVQMMHLDLHEFEATPLLKAYEWSEVPDAKKTHLFDNYFVIINTPHQVPTKEVLDDLNAGTGEPTEGWIMPRMESLAAVLAQMDIPMRFDICPFDTSIWATISHHHAKFSSETAMKILVDLHEIIDVLLKKPETLIRDLVKP